MASTIMTHKHRCITFCRQRSSDSFISYNQRSVGDDCYGRMHSKSYREEFSLRKTKTFTHKRTHRPYKVLYKARCKTIIKVTFSPDSPGSRTPDFCIYAKGAKESFCSLNDLNKSYKFFMDPSIVQYGVPADIVVKDNDREERMSVPNLLDINNAHTLQCQTIQMKLTVSTPEMKLPDIRSYDNTEGFLCREETEFMELRKCYIKKSLEKLVNHDIDSKDVPHIALIGSGGGYRAMVAMSGIFNALYDSGVLDYILYTAALSGSSWYISTLYSHPEWPCVNPRKIQEDLKANISSNPIKLSKILYHGWDFISKKFNGQNWSFTTDVFAPLLGNVLIKDRTDTRWSEQAYKMGEGTVPLPLLAAIHANIKENAKIFHEWVEFSPYEVSIPKYGFAVSMTQFGSEFSRGVLTREHEEIPLYEIMGICGSAFTITLEELKNKDTGDSKDKSKKNKLKRPDAVTSQSKTNCEVDDVLEEVAEFVETDGKPCDARLQSSDDDDEEDELLHPIKSEPPSTEELEDLFSLACQIREKDGHKFQKLESDSTHSPLNNMITGNIKSNISFSEEGVISDNENSRERRTTALSSDIDKDGITDYIPEILKSPLLNDRSNRAAFINNPLRQLSFDDSPVSLREVKNPLFKNNLENDMKKLCLIDAGLALNSPFPLLFQPGRDIDLILSFDFTDRKKDSNEPFKTLLRAEEWAEQHNIKFPRIDVEKYKGKDVQELYIFEDEDPECPTIMHFVLVNKDFRHYKKPGIKRSKYEEEFADFNIYDDQKTFHCTNFQYSKTNFERLSQLSQFIVLNNIHKIKDCVEKSIINKHDRSISGTRRRHRSGPK